MENKPKIFNVTRTPKSLDNILSVKPDIIKNYYCAVINVSDSQCATFDYANEGFPSFWFPINEIGMWGHGPFLGALRVVENFYKGDKKVLIHCHAGANRSPSVAYAILLAKGYTPEEAAVSLDYENIAHVFERNVRRKHIPDNIVPFLQAAMKNPTYSIHGSLQEIDAAYNEWAQKKFAEQNNYMLTGDPGTSTRLVYDKPTKRFVIVKDTV
jgi:hypothetical protein